jgi:ATP-binding cassette subfamily B protein
LGASDETAKEVKIFGLSDFISGRFKTLINFIATIANWQYAGQFGNFFLSVLGTLGYYAAYAFIIYETVTGKSSVGSLTF